MNKRWKVTIRTATSVEEFFIEEIEELHDIVEGGPDWTDPGYKIEVEYNL